MNDKSLVAGEICAHPDTPSRPAYQLLEPAKFVPNAWICRDVETRMKTVVPCDRLCPVSTDRPDARAR